MTAKLEGNSLPLNREAAIAAVSTLQPLLDRLPDHIVPLDLASRLPESSGDLAAEAIDEWDDGDGAINFVQSLIMARILEKDLKPSSHMGNLIVSTEEAQVAISHGPLSVSGSLDLDANLIVLGDLLVGGRVRDLVPWTRLIVTENLKCRTVWSGSPIWVGGAVDAEVVYLSHHGKIWCGDELRATLLIASQEAKGVTGEVNAQHYFAVEAWQEDPQGTLERLEEILVPEAFVGTDRNTGFFQPENLLKLVEAGAPYLQPSAGVDS